MEIQASVIQIDTAYNGDLVIAAEGFSVDESGSILIKLDSGIQKLFVITISYGSRIPVIGNSRADYLHINSAICGICQTVLLSLGLH